MRYLSLFSGIGGFELGIQQAYEKISLEKINKPTMQVYGNVLENERLDSKTRKGLPTPSTQKKNNQIYHNSILNEYERLSNEVEQRGRGQEKSELETPLPVSFSKPNQRQHPTCIGYSEIDKYAIQIYQKHFNHTNYGDITKIKADELPDFDFLCGGFPCQSFSIAGKRKGFSDTRGTLFFDIARILKAKQPSHFLLENVKGLLSHDNGQTFATIIATLDELGYDLQWQVLNSKDFGVPQNRERVFIIGHLRGTPRPEVFPIIGQIESTLGESRAIAMHNKRRIATITKQVNTLSSSFRGHPDGDGRPALIQNMRIRRLTPKECERLQGFPDDWTAGVSDTQRYKCLGNAVTVNVIQAIMEKF